MGDEQNREPIKKLAFTPPTFVDAPKPDSNQKTKGKSKPKKPYSTRKQIRRAKKTYKLPISARRLFVGVFVLLLAATTATAIFAPEKLETIASGEFIKNTETCTVTEMNSSNFFDTTCGKFEWRDEIPPATLPMDELVVGQSYTFESVGLRIGPAQVFPHVTSYTLAEATPSE